MINQLNMLRKENNIRDKELSKENSTIMTDMVCYLRASNLCDYDLENIRKELIGMAIEAQLRGEFFGDVVGEDYKVFCIEIIKNGRQKTSYEKILGILYTVVFSIMVLFVAEIFFSATIYDIFKLGRFDMPITLGFVISTLMVVGLGNSVYYYFTKHSFDFSKKSRKIRIQFVLGFAILWVATVLVRLLFEGTVLLTINCLYIITGLVISFILIKYFFDRYTNSFFKTCSLNHAK